MAALQPSLRYSAFDKLQRVSHAAIVENKRLGEILAWIKEQQDRQPRLNTIPKGPRRSSQASGLLKNLPCEWPRPPNRSRKLPAEAGAAPIGWSPRRRLALLARPPSDISTLQKSRHLYFVATTAAGAKPTFGRICTSLKANNRLSIGTQQRRHPKALNRLALEFGFGRAGARWYVPYSFNERARWLKRNSLRTCRTGWSSTRTATLRAAEPTGTCTR